ncbi:hypothetical protein Q361_1135 [Flavobacterium croceum DSM 17960]|uniref:Uncharacterized protein n=1 Tax=Flavobacterium croceum DSM 17960 TaxID=1121886 RepID=A0A2S4N618_9FLAO|nr:hypothetical protein [Flavobacterium croceum]POS01126.1 hypothetical protein Q361_1135 [Flavobacterium croceum DSM 17960]
MKKRHQQKLVVLSIVLLVLFNLPIVLLFDISSGIVGIPIVYVYLFSVWLVSILLSFYIVKKYHE